MQLRLLNLQNGAKSDGKLSLLVGLSGNRQLTIDFRGRTATLGTDKAIPWSELGFVCLPTYASDRFELRIKLDKLGVKPGDTISLNFTGSDQLDKAATVVLRKGEDQRREISFAKTGDFRLANLNTLRGGLSDPIRYGAIKRLLAAANADVYCFQEEWDERKFRKSAPTAVPSSGKVNLHWIGGCGIATTLPLKPIPMKLDRAAAAAISLPGEKQLVVFSVHFKCCGYTGSKEDKTRIHQAQQVVAGIRKMRTGKYGEELKRAGIVVIGDYNLVGSRQPLDIIKTAGMKDWILPGADGAAYTWRGITKKESFWPGRLDVVAYDREALKPSQGFVLDTLRLSRKTSRFMGLLAEDSLASDHLMLIADFQFVR